jgi:hypothetical protein
MHSQKLIIANNEQLRKKVRHVMKTNGADPFLTLDRGDNHHHALPTLLLQKEPQYILGYTVWTT